MADLVALMFILLLCFVLGMVTGAGLVIEGQKSDQRRKEAEASDKWDEILQNRRNDRNGDDDWNGWFQ